MVCLSQNELLIRPPSNCLGYPRTHQFDHTCYRVIQKIARFGPKIETFILMSILKISSNYTNLSILHTKNSKLMKMSLGCTPTSDPFYHHVPWKHPHRNIRQRHRESSSRGKRPRSCARAPRPDWFSHQNSIEIAGMFMVIYGNLW